MCIKDQDSLAAGIDSKHSCTRDLRPSLYNGDKPVLHYIQVPLYNVRCQGNKRVISIISRCQGYSRVIIKSHTVPSGLYYTVG